MNQGACFPIAKTMKSEFSISLEFLEITSSLDFKEFVFYFWKITISGFSNSLESKEFGTPETMKSVSIKEKQNENP